MGSQASDVIHLVCPLRASPIAFPVFGSQMRTCPSCPPLANLLSIGSHSTQSTHPLWPESVWEGVSVFRSHSRALVSPDPVAKSFPVGENEAQRIGEECPRSISVRCYQFPKPKSRPESVEEHLVAGRTRKTLCGEQCTTIVSSGVNFPEGWFSTSASMDLVTTIREGLTWPDFTSSGRATWKEKGTGPSSCCSHSAKWTQD